MTNDQLIAMLFPVGAGIAAVIAGYVGLKWIAPRPVDEPKQALDESALREKA